MKKQRPRHREAGLASGRKSDFGPGEDFHVPQSIPTSGFRRVLRRGCAMNAAQLAAALSRRAEEVCRLYLPHGRRQGRYWVAGDLDGARGRSLFVRLEGPGVPGKWSDMATSEHGDLLDLVRRRSGAPSLRAALAEARAFLGLPAAQPNPSAPSGGFHNPSASARRLWRACQPIDGTHAERYLRARGLSRRHFAALRFHPALRHREGGATRTLPALVAAVTDRAGKVTGIQRTWLDPSAPAKARLATPRKALGRVHGHAVRFGAPDGTLLVGEGIETVLSLASAAPALVAAAALSAGSLGAFAPPSGVRRLIIARDNDPAGGRAAGRLSRRCDRDGVAAVVLTPAGGDFNDDLLTLGPAALAARLAPLLRGGATGAGG